MSNFFSIGAMNQLADALENAGYSADYITKLKQFKNLSGIKDVLDGKAEIKMLEISVSRWCEENCIIYFSVTSDGTTGEEWIARLISKGFKVGGWAKSLLRSADFKPTNGVTTEIAVLKGKFFTDENRITEKIRSEASKRNMIKPNPEVACLIREMFSDEDIKAMGFSWIVTMHEPIKDSGGNFLLMSTRRYDVDSSLNANYVNPVIGWFIDSGFAFAVS